MKMGAVSSTENLQHKKYKETRGSELSRCSARPAISRANSRGGTERREEPHKVKRAVPRGTGHGGIYLANASLSR